MKHGFWGMWIFSSCGTWVYLPRAMWTLPRPGIEPMSSALVGEFLTTEVPGKSHNVLGEWNCVVDFYFVGEHPSFLTDDQWLICISQLVKAWGSAERVFFVFFFSFNFYYMTLCSVRWERKQLCLKVQHSYSLQEKYHRFDNQDQVIRNERNLQGRW